MLITNKRALADKVLTLVKRNLIALECDKSERVSLESYQNGREQGHALCYIGRGLRAIWVAWAENRNSDQIVVYHDDTTGCVSGLSEEAYKNARYFDYKNTHIAADCITTLIREKVWECEREAKVDAVIAEKSFIGDGPDDEGSR